MKNGKKRLPLLALLVTLSPCHLVTLSVCLLSGCVHLWGDLPAIGTEGSTAKKPTTPHSEQHLDDRETAELCLTLAEELEKNGREVEAIAQYEKAREKDPRLSGRVS